MRIACFTTVYNEAYFLPVWFSYYAKALGARNLTILDHGSNDGSLRSLRDRVSIVRLPRTGYDEQKRTDAVNAFKTVLFQYYDVVIFTDCDEFIVPDPAYYPGGLREYCKISPPLSAPVGLQVLHVVDKERPLEDGRPILRQRRFCRFHSDYCKPLIAKEPVTWTPGFHHADRKCEVARNVYLFHIKAADRDHALKRHRFLRSMAWSSATVAAGWGWHQRIGDEAFIDIYFEQPLEQLRRTTDVGFSFAEDLTRLVSSVEEKDGYCPASFAGKVARRPRRFRDCF
ncbi:MAG TPA: glycosyltransferase family 2 protein [Bauldia sp.]|nr:glycosyltransferase family 2 protein [Bauldia sp.]